MKVRARLFARIRRGNPPVQIQDQQSIAPTNQSTRQAAKLIADGRTDLLDKFISKAASRFRRNESSLNVSDFTRGKQKSLSHVIHDENAGNGLPALEINLSSKSVCARRD